MIIDNTLAVRHLPHCRGYNDEHKNGDRKDPSPFQSVPPDRELHFIIGVDTLTLCCDVL